MKRLVARIVAVLVIISLSLASWELYFRKPAADAVTRPLSVTDETTIRELASALKEASVISSATLFSIVAKLSGEAQNLRPGVFLFKEGMSVDDVLKVLNLIGRGEQTVTIPEGMNLRQIAERLVSTGVLKGTDELFAVTGAPLGEASIDPSLIAEFPFLADKPTAVGLEGYLFPDTYRFFEQSTALEVVRRMLLTYRMKTEGKTVTHEVLTLASILEKEVATVEDRKLVADLLTRRLQVGMPLQVDSSVNYVTGKSVPSVSNDDLAADSRYNTYTYKGLPPGPISSPGLSSIEAALAPTPNGYWYFLTTKDGTVIYSRTAEQHGVAKAKYLR